MTGHEPETAARLERIRGLAAADQLRLTRRAQQEMAEEGITLDEVCEAIRVATLVEHYPEHRRGPGCLVWGRTEAGRALHIVCTTAQPLLILITVYEPRPPKWITPQERRKLS